MKLCKGALTLSPPDFFFLVIASIVWSHQKLSQNRLHIVRRSAYLTVFLFTGFLANPVDITIVEFESQVDDIFCAWKRVDIRTSLSMFWVLFFSVQTSSFLFLFSWESCLRRKALISDESDVEELTPEFTPVLSSCGSKCFPTNTHLPVLYFSNWVLLLFNARSGGA